MAEDLSDLAAHFEQWYADMAGHPVKDEIQQRHLGLPPELLSTSLLTWDGIAEVASLLGLEPGDRLVDLACGRGGYGLEIARRTGASLVGIDFAASALTAARALADRREQQAEFLLGDLVATGLPDEHADAVLVVDAIQFPSDPRTAYAEIFRILKPGAPVVLTCWEATSPEADGVPERIRNVDLHGGLTGAGFTDVRVTGRPDWRAVERGLWEEAVALDPGDDPALQSFHDEGVRSLETFDAMRRMIAVARRPA